MRQNALPFGQKHYALAGASIAILLVVLGMELVSRRFWCRYLCPSGALLGVIARYSAMRRLPLVVCKGCPASGDCADNCRMGAFTSDRKFVADDCNLCMDCVGDCPRHVATFKLNGWRRRRRADVPPALRPPGIQISRRAFVGAVGVGIATPIIARAARAGLETKPSQYLLRPPGAADDQRLLDLCVRCGQCMKVCPTNTLQPDYLGSGIEGMFAPRLVPRIGQCEFSCTLCGQVCPTGAIPKLMAEQKHQTIIGKAVFNQDLCLPWAKNEECICCEEHCPVSEKAIQYDLVEVTNAWGERVTLQRPYVVFDRCIGCGICEFVCPVEGEAAIRVQRTETVDADAVGRGQMTRRRYRGGRDGG
jgi:ferredoxin